MPKDKLPFKIICPKCRKHSELNRSVVYAQSYDCGRCSSTHTDLTITCPKCGYYIEDNEV